MDRLVVPKKKKNFKKFNVFPTIHQGIATHFYLKRLGEGTSGSELLPVTVPWPKYMVEKCSPSSCELWPIKPFLKQVSTSGQPRPESCGGKSIS